MEFQISCPNNAALKELGLGFGVFVGGGLVSYVLFKYLPANSDACATDNGPQSPELVKQVVSLKDEIKYLKSKLATALYDVGKGMDDIRVSQQRLSQIHLGQVPAAQPPYSFQRRRTSSQGQMPASPFRQQSPIGPSPLAKRRISRDSTDDDDYQSVKDVLSNDNYEAETMNPILNEIDQLNSGSDQDRDKALSMLHEQEASHPSSSQVKWRLARAHLWRYGESERPEVKRLHANSALRYSQEALRLNENSPDCHKWYAVSLATSLDYKSPAEKIARNDEVKKHIERAIELDPLEPMPYYIKGKWCWGVYKLKWIEKRLTKDLYGSPPNMSLEEVIQPFLEAETIAPGFSKGNRVYIAKCYLEKADFETAKSWFLAALTMPITGKEDASLQAIIKEHLSDLRENSIKFFC